MINLEILFLLNFKYDHDCDHANAHVHVNGLIQPNASVNSRVHDASVHDHDGEWTQE